jgi:hypothetical protein
MGQQNPSVGAALALVLATGLGHVAHAETTKYGSLQHHTELPEALFLVGEIRDGDSFELRRAMRDHDIRLVVAASPGGSVYEGLQMASILHDRGINTYIPEDASCESSCAKVFLGGSKRMVLGELGVHQFYSGTPNAARQERKDVTTSVTQYTTSEIIGILNEFETPPFVYEKMFATTDIYYFKGAEKQRLNIGADDEFFLDQVSRIDDFLVLQPSVLEREARPPALPAIPPSDPVVTAAPSPQQPSENRVFQNMDFFGMDLSSEGIRNVSLSQCQSYCRSTPNCAAYSYVHASRWCWPKSGIENISLAADVTSGIVDYGSINVEVFDRPFFEATGLDVSGFDLYPDGLRNMTLDQCRHACQATTGCVAFSYVPKQSWCFPKYGVRQLTKQLGIISGVLKER